MRRKTAIRLSITIDRELASWLDEYAYCQRVTKSVILEELVKALQEVFDEYKTSVDLSPEEIDAALDDSDRNRWIEKNVKNSVYGRFADETLKGDSEND